MTLTELLPPATLDLSSTVLGWCIAAVFVIAYIILVWQEKNHLPKSVPMLSAAGLIGLATILVYHQAGKADVAVVWVEYFFLDATFIFFFLVCAMIFVHVAEERRVFDAISSRMERGGWSHRTIFWATGVTAFFVSPVADNMATALIFGSVFLTAMVPLAFRDLSPKQKQGIVVGCINIIAAANAGGAFSPFGDVTTLMAWEAGVLPFWTFFHLIPASFAQWVTLALMLMWFVPEGRADAAGKEAVVMKPGAKRVIAIFILSIVLAVTGKQLFHTPAAFGMLLGVALLKSFCYYMDIRSAEDAPFHAMKQTQRVEWDTLLFIMGVVIAIQCLAFLGFGTALSNLAYAPWGPFDQEGATTVANVSVGVVSAVIDNVPVMQTVLSMRPEMSEWQWLLVTYTAGTGGSMLAIGSLAGVALMGHEKAKGVLTFGAYLKFTPFVFVSYLIGVGIHYLYALWFAPYLF